jgi:hypothetical protein
MEQDDSTCYFAEHKIGSYRVSYITTYSYRGLCSCFIKSLAREDTVGWKS